MPLPGTRVTLPCSAQPSAGEDIRYRWTRYGEVVGPEVRVQGELVIASVREDESDNGVYECLLVVSVEGVTSEPLLISVGTTTLTVGGELIGSVSALYQVLLAPVNT